MRLAWFTPLPPVQSGISAYSADLLPRLAERHEIDVYVHDQPRTEHVAGQPAPSIPHSSTQRPPSPSAQHPFGASTFALRATVDKTVGKPQHPERLGHPAIPSPPLAGEEARVRGQAELEVRSAHDFVSAHYHRPYDLIVYQVGNARCHDYMWPYLLRYPGLVVLHDGQLHHARALMLLTRFRFDDYRAEFAWSHPTANPNAAEYATGTFEGMSYFLWPMIRPVMTRAIRVAVHNRLLSEALAEAHPETPIDRIRMGVPAFAEATAAFVPPEGTDYGEPRRSPWRRRAGRPEPASGFLELSGVEGSSKQVGSGGGRPLGLQATKGPLFASFGLVTPEKRIPQILRAFAHVLESAPAARLVLVGGTVSHFDAAALARELNIAHAVTITGFVDDERHDELMMAADVCLCLRWPTSRETSASWLRCLAAGKATVINDLEHLVDVPSMDPRDWTTLHASRGTLGSGVLPEPDPIAVSIDILDEDHSLRLSMVRLAMDGGLRKRLGDAAQAYWRTYHTLDAMVEDYERVLALAASTPPRTAPSDLPAHLLAEGMSVVKHVTSSIGVEFDW